MNTEPNTPAYAPYGMSTTRPRQGTVQGKMERFFEEQFLQFFKLAEKKRRWSPFDIDYRQSVPDAATPDIVETVRNHRAVERMLPDFSREMLNLISRSRGRSWFHVNWSYEEEKHTLALEGWLQGSGHETAEQYEQFEEEMWGVHWPLPFGNPLPMIVYTAAQEEATFWSYRNLEEILPMHLVDGKMVPVDPVIAEVLRKLSIDEKVHHNFYMTAAQEWMKHDPAAVADAVQEVFGDFAMPGLGFLPHMQERAKVLERSKIYSPRQYIAQVKRPVLAKLGLTSHFLKLDQAKAHEVARAAVEAKYGRESIILQENGCAIPRRTPLMTVMDIEPQVPAQSVPITTWESLGMSPTTAQIIAHADSISNQVEN